MSVKQKSVLLNLKSALQNPESASQNPKSAAFCNKNKPSKSLHSATDSAIPDRTAAMDDIHAAISRLQESATSATKCHQRNNSWDCPRFERGSGTFFRHSAKISCESAAESAETGAESPETGAVSPETGAESVETGAIGMDAGNVGLFVVADIVTSMP